MAFCRPENAQNKIKATQFKNNMKIFYSLALTCKNNEEVSQEPTNRSNHSEIKPNAIIVFKCNDSIEK